MKRAAVLLVVLAGCPDPVERVDRIELVGITHPPPASTGVIRTRDSQGEDIYRIELSVGVALAARCWDTCDADALCVLPAISAADPALLDILPVYRQGLHGEYALVAKQPGTTTLHLATACVSADYQVTILPRTP